MTNAAAGWYDDGTGQQRWWDGAVWTEHIAPSSEEQQQTPAATPAGWYDDGTGQQRWWDGVRWTDHVAPVSTTATEPAPAQQTSTALPGWYDDGSGRKRWWDGAQWGSYEVSSAIPMEGGGIQVEFRPTWPLWFVIKSDPLNPRFVRVRVHRGFDASTAPNFDSPDQLADAEVDDWEGAPLDMAVHSSQRERILMLGTEMVEILDDVARQVQSAVDRVAYDGAD